MDLTPLRSVLRDQRLDLRLIGRDDLGENRRLARRFDQTLKGVQLVLDNWNWYAKKLNDHTMNAARLIVPDEVTGAVILDATANPNLIYKLFDYRVDVIPVPSVARRYDNVTLHVSKGHAVGKTALAGKAKEEAGKLVAALEAKLSKDRKVFVCCHQQVEAQVVSYSPRFAAFEVGHWGAIDGRNSWHGFDTAVIFGLPYRDRIWSANTFMALQGLQSTEWLTAEGNRPFREYHDIRAALQTGQLVVSIVQAINRVRCRRVVDAEGNCEPTDVFLLLPAGSTGDDILEGIKREMPAINVVPWSYQAARRKPKRSNWEEAVVSYAATMLPGRKAAKTVREELGVPRSCWERMVAKLKDVTTDLSRRLADKGVTYFVEGAGRRQSAYLVRSADL